MIVFVSNYYNHHQSPFSEAMDLLTEGNYRFIATEPMEQERLQMGWGRDNAPFVLQYSDTPEECQQLIDTADAVIFGSAPYNLFKKRLREEKLTFLYSERIYKHPCPAWQIPLRTVKYFWKYGRFRNLYLLCASAYTASDYAKTGTFLGKAYKWGYFPELKVYENIDTLINAKKPASILWVARMIDWKHPELPVQIARRLKEEGYTFTMNLIGNGVMEQTIRQMIEDLDVSDCVHMLGAMKPQEVREHMEQSQIFLFTSDRNEGWGAVLNEAMNSGCAVVANRAIGSVPYLLKHGENGLIYDEQFASLYSDVKFFLNNPNSCKDYGKNAYKTIISMWNAEIAAKRILDLCKCIKMNHIDGFETGIGSISK